MGRIKRRDLISKISIHKNIRADVVEEVIEGLVDLAIEEIVNSGEFGVKDLFSISNFDWKAYEIEGKKVEAQKRLKIRLSEKIKFLWRLKNSSSEYGDNFINKDNWSEVYKYYSSNKNVEEKVTKDTTMQDMMESLFSDEF